EGEGYAEGVRVGEVMVRLGGHKEKERNAGVADKGINENIGQVAQPTKKEAVTSASVFVRKYKPAMEDVQWAQ
ncbi:hypothetical protein A2U01_0106153, partial [Trifolium medium]|nr:hypothetical protein [Trifolium medium]